MKKYFLFMALAFLLTGCANSQKQVYREIETTLTSQVIDEGDPSTESNKEIKRLQEKGEIFWHDQSRKISGRTPMYYLQYEIKCKNGDKNDATKDCSIVGLQANQNNLPPEYKVDKDKCDTDGWCLITEPEFQKDLANKIQQLDGFYGFGKDIYTIGSVKNDNNYSIFKNGKEIFYHTMFYGAENPIEDAGIVLNSPAFTFSDLKDWQDEDNPVAYRNIWYNGETLNEKYGVEASSYLFSFKDKTGFVGEDNGGKFIFFNGQKISQNFDEIRTHGCCAVLKYPIEIYENGTLFFLANRGEKYFFVEINLNEYLK